MEPKAAPKSRGARVSGIDRALQILDYLQETMSPAGPYAVAKAVGALILLDTPIRSVNAYTQTIGIYPDSLKATIRDQLIFQGAQRLTTLGSAVEIRSTSPDSRA